jgi:hypothetical protein
MHAASILDSLCLSGCLYVTAKKNKTTRKKCDTRRWLCAGSKQTATFDRVTNSFSCKLFIYIKLAIIYKLLKEISINAYANFSRYKFSSVSSNAKAQGFSFSTLSIEVYQMDSQKDLLRGNLATR